MVPGKSLESSLGCHPLSPWQLNRWCQEGSSHCLPDPQARLPWPIQGIFLHTSRGMANTGLTNFNQHGILPVWPFLGREGSLVPPTQPSDCHSDGKELPAPQRTKPARRVVDFSIRSILALDGSEVEGENRYEKPARDAVEWTGAPQGHTWICCTRFRPPSIPSRALLHTHTTPHTPRIRSGKPNEEAFISSPDTILT